MTISGCASKSRSDEQRDLRAEGQELFSSGPAGSRAEEQAGTAVGGWAIVLESFSGPGAAEAAQRRMAEISTLLGRTDLSIRTMPSGAGVVLGRYPSYDTRQAQADLAMVRTFTSGGRLPFAQAFLAPPSETTDPGLIPELNLASARQVFGERATYTLQIGVYESAQRDVAKRAAEEAALRLRREGELAFYHHGRQRSSVTVGIFSDRDLDEQLRPASDILVQLMRRYPLNLLNGQYPIVERSTSGASREQASMLVRIP